MKICEEMRNFYISKFNEYGEPFLITLCNLSLAQTLFLDAYKKLEPIENMPPDEKLDLKKYVHGMFPTKNVDFKLKAAKIIYTLGNLI